MKVFDDISFMKKENKYSKLSVLLFTLVSFISGCGLNTEILPSTASPTALIDGTFNSVCVNEDINTDGFQDGVKLFFKIDSGTSYSAILFYDQDTDCSGSYTMHKMADGSPITEPELDSTNMEFLSVPDAPANFHVVYGEDAMNNGAPIYNLVYKQDNDNFYLLADAIASNQGSVWADWIASSTDATGFAAAPTSFTPGTGGGAGGGDSFAIHLIRVP